MKQAEMKWLQRALRSLTLSTDFSVEVGRWVIMARRQNAARLADRRMVVEFVQSPLPPGVAVVSNDRFVVCLVSGSRERPPDPWPLDYYVSEWAGGERLPWLVQPLTDRVREVTGIRLDPESQVFALWPAIIGWDDAQRPIPILAASLMENRSVILQAEEVLGLGDDALLVAVRDLPPGLPEGDGHFRDCQIGDTQAPARLAAVKFDGKLWAACRVMFGEIIHLPDGESKRVPGLNTSYLVQWVALMLP